jgi:predicted ATP-grasp superfamily ATP-dependent carboligase
MLAGLKARKAQRLYNNTTSWFLAEEYIHGEEYSCDFIIKDDCVRIIRLTRKIKDSKSPFGTISGYKLADFEAEGLNRSKLENILRRGALSLNIVEAICMVDFLLCDNEIILLEMTPRPGGDCIPSLLKLSGPFDILTFTLDFAQGRRIDLPKWQNGRYVALRLHAKKSGTVKQIDASLLRKDSRVLEVRTACAPGHHVDMPPQDYDSWYLGHIIFKPAPGIALQQQCQELRQQLVLEMEYDN